MCLEAVEGISWPEFCLADKSVPIIVWIEKLLRGNHVVALRTWIVGTPTTNALAVEEHKPLFATDALAIFPEIGAVGDNGLVDVGKVVER